MKDFIVYTALRLGLFAVVYGVLIVIARLAGAGDGAWLWLLLGAMVISAVLSLKLLAPQRDRLAQNVQDRAARATARFEEMKAKEDAED